MNILDMTLAERLDENQLLPVRQRALVEFVEGMYPTLKRFLLLNHVPIERLDDIASDVWLTVVKKIEEGEYRLKEGQPTSYVFGIAAKTLLRTPAHMSRETALTTEEDLPDMTDDYAASDATMDIAHIAQLLTDPEDLAVFAALLQQKSITEMAAEFDVCYKTAWRRWHRCLDHCRDAIHASKEVEANVNS